MSVKDAKFKFAILSFLLHNVLTANFPNPPLLSSRVKAHLGEEDCAATIIIIYLMFFLQVLSTLSAGFQTVGDSDSPPSIEAVGFSSL